MKTLPALFALLLTAFSAKVHAQQPLTALDSTFSQDGILDVDSLRLMANGKVYLALQSDGKILTAGTYGEWLGTKYEMGAQLLRFLPDGSRDSSFGQAGGLWLPGNGAYENCIGLQLLPDGRIVTATATSVYQGNSYTIRRLLHDGTPDPSFNDSGKAVFSPTLPGTGHVYYHALAVQPDGGILLTGHWTVPTLYHFLNTFRYTSAGVPDSSYGLDGRASVGLHNTYKIDGRVLVALPDARFLVGGQAQDTPLWFNRNKAILARCLPNGTLDTSFGSGAGFFKHTSPGARHSAISSVIVRPNGALLAAVISQYYYDGPWKISVVQLTPTGLLDAAFGIGGIATADSTPNDAVNSSPPQLALQADGRPLLSFVDGMDTAARKFAVRRMTAVGAPDGSFGAEGKVATRISPVRPGGASCIAVQANGKVLVGGTNVQTVGGYTSLGLVRYHPYISLTRLQEVPRMTGESRLQLYPNPATSTIQLIYTLPKAAEVSIDLLDVQGRTMQACTRVKQMKGLQNETIFLPQSLSPGLYFVLVRGGDYVAKAVLVKQ